MQNSTLDPGEITTDMVREWVNKLRPANMDIDSFFVPPELDPNKPGQDGKFTYLLNPDATPKEWHTAIVSVSARLDRLERVIAGVMRHMYKNHDLLVRLVLLALDQADQEAYVDDMTKLAEETEARWAAQAAEGAGNGNTN